MASIPTTSAAAALHATRGREILRAERALESGVTLPAGSASWMVTSVDKIVASTSAPFEEIGKLWAGSAPRSRDSKLVSMTVAFQDLG